MNNNVTKIYSEEDGINVIYDENFLETKFANEALELFESQLKYQSKKQSQIKLFGKTIYIPRKQVAYGDKNISYRYSGSKVKANDWNKNTKMCKLLLEIKEKAEKYTGLTFNFVLINRYEDGEQYISPHKDKEKDLGPNPSVVGVSLGAERQFIFEADKFTPKDTKPVHKISLKHGSIVVMKQPTNNYWKHSLPKDKTIKQPRLSLTFRKIITNNN